MVRNILNELTARGVRHLIISALFFVVYALCGTAIMLTVLFLIDRHIQGESISFISAAWLLGGLLVLKTLSNAIADMSKHFAGFDLVERIREKIILKLKMFSLGFYTNERLGEISTIIHKDVHCSSNTRYWTILCGLAHGIDNGSHSSYCPVFSVSGHSLGNESTGRVSGQSGRYGQPLCRIRQGHSSFESVWRKRNVP